MNKSAWDNCLKINVDLHEYTFEYLQKMINDFFYCLRCIYYHRSLNEFINSQDSLSHIQYLVITNNCYFDVAVIHWSKLFGSKNSEKTHYLNLLTFKELQRFFIKLKIIDHNHLEARLLKYIQLNKDDFDKYKNASIIKYRDKYLSHNDLQIILPLKKYPSFDIAEKSLTWLYTFISSVIMSNESDKGNHNLHIYKIETIKEEINKEANLLVTSLTQNSK